MVKLRFFRFGGLKNSATAAIEMAPKGRLIQKHHLQETLSVRAPPSNGPTTDEMLLEISVSAFPQELKA